MGVDIVIKAFDTSRKGFEERLLFLQYDALNELLLADKFSVLATHLADKCVDQPVDEGLFKVEEGVSIAYCTAQNTTDNIASFGIAG